MRILLSILFTSLVYISTIYAYWGIAVQNPNQVERTFEAEIGSWYVQDKEDPNSPELVYFYEDNPPNKPIKAGSLVVYISKDGSKSFRALRELWPADGLYDPSKPNTSIFRKMSYTENTAEYRPFHHYYKDDYVIFEGRLYRYTNRLVAHKPNTPSQRTPAESSRWELVNDLPDGVSEEDLWYKYKLYFSGDRVYAKDSWYTCLYDGFTNKWVDEDWIWDKD